LAQNPVASGARTGAAAGGAVAGPPGAAVGAVTGAAAGAAAGLAGAAVAAPAAIFGSLGGAGFVDAWTFRRMANSTNLFEIQSSRMALQRSRNPAVRRFAQQMLADHTRATAALAQFNYDTPPALDPRHAGMLQQLSAARGRAFDRLYARMQVMAHQETVALFSTYAQTGEWWELRQFAGQTVPRMQAHLQMAVAVSRRV
jgi:putative membrane protein